MRNRKLSPTGDYVFGGGLQDFYIDVPAAVGQAVGTRLKLWLGEWFNDLSDGTDYPGGVLGKHTQAQADATVQARTLGTENISDIEKFESTLDTVNRFYSVQMTINTIYGPTQVQLQNYVNY